jgi:hypothetical protein
VTQQYESVNKAIVKRTNFVAEPLFWSWNETTRINGTTVSDGSGNFVNPLETLYNDGDEDIMPTVGTKHQSIDGAYCTRVAVDPVSEEDPVNFDVVTSWIEEGDCAEVSYDLYQVTEVSNFAVDPDSQDSTVLTKVVYTPTNGGPTINATVPFVADIRIPRILKAIRIRQFETLPNTLPDEVMDTAPPFWNNDDFAGYGPGDLLYIGRKGVCIFGTPIYDFTYTILFNERGWHHFYAVWEDSRGLVPRDITPIAPSSVKPSDGNIVAKSGNSKDPHNGAAAYQMLISESFSDYTDLQNLKPPFLTGSSS